MCLTDFLYFKFVVVHVLSWSSGSEERSDKFGFGDVKDNCRGPGALCKELFFELSAFRKSPVHD